jgi:hypothetical protein
VGRLLDNVCHELGSVLQNGARFKRPIGRKMGAYDPSRALNSPVCFCINFFHWEWNRVGGIFAGKEKGRADRPIEQAQAYARAFDWNWHDIDFIFKIS